ncbi:NUDIX hydrolase [Thioclava kandeliae]|uniref:NUDIX hydrolase n=1 Tax=Thioclava kandeliae TaxID=3070818 RepID=A0ABV1SGS6_9RHOB
MIPRLGEAARRGQKYRMRPGAYALLCRGDQVLLTHQAAPVPEFQLPGGGIDPGESAIAALHREVREETGWGIAEIRRIGTYRRFVYMPDYDMWAEKICHIHTARPTICYGQPSEAGHQAVWQPIGNTIEIISSKADKVFLERFFGTFKA